MQKSKAVTVRDIAKASGVSAATVSRVLSKSNYPVKQEVRDMVLRISGELNYQIGLTYRPRKTVENELAILIPTMSNPFYTSIVAGFESVAAHEGFHSYVLDVNAWFSGGNVRQILYSLFNKNVKGVLVAAPAMYSVVEEFQKDLVSRNIKVVLADYPKQGSIFNNVFYDYKKGSYLATEYLISKGHRKIVYAGLELERESRNLRVQGYKDAMLARQLPYGKDTILIHSGEDTNENTQIESGEKLARWVMNLRERPSAVVVINDIVAFGMLRAFHHRGIKVPGEFSIIGFDDSVFCDMSYPALTTVKVQSEQMGHMAAMLLLNDIRGISQSSIGLSLEPCIVERDTVAVFSEK
ncbi:LacI family transcriptional regulator [Spirochaetia bacterium]|nr:LacI family transcriptional regulator [Spirochaetia bacterium]